MAANWGIFGVVRIEGFLAESPLWRLDAVGVTDAGYEGGDHTFLRGSTFDGKPGIAAAFVRLVEPPVEVQPGSAAGRLGGGYGGVEEGLRRVFATAREGTFQSR